MTIDEALRIVGQLSEPSKMPCWGYSLPAPGMNGGVGECKLGAKLIKVPGSVCSICYARKGRYVMLKVRAAMARRAEAIHDPRWVDAMVYILAHKKLGKKHLTHFRWHDSGDLQGTWHLRNIVQVARRTLHVRHWLTTRESAMVWWVLAEDGPFPANLIVRRSGTMIGDLLNAMDGTVVSGVNVKEAFQCPAPGQNNNCGECRACWDLSVSCVSYAAH